MEEAQSQEQSEKQNDKPWLFKPGQSGNPGGRPKGSKSLKTYAKEYLLSLPDDEKLEYMAGMDKRAIWEMAEGKAKQETEHSGTLTISQVLDNLENDRPETPEQELESK